MLQRRWRIIYTIAIVLLLVGVIVAPYVIESQLPALIVQFILIVFLSHQLIFYKQKSTLRYDFFMKFVQISIPLLVLFSVILMWVRPDIAATAGTEDYWLEVLQPTVLFLSSLTLLISAGFCIVRKSLVGATAAFLGAALLFVLGMEEISWMQRILEVESSEYFLQHNMQQETNLHNLSSGLFNTLYLMAAFLLLVVAPYYDRLIKKVLTKAELTSIHVFVPSRWLFIAFAPTVGLLNISHASSIWLLFTIALTGVLLAREAFENYKKSNTLAGVWYICMIVLIGFSYITTVFGPVAGIDPIHAPFEFRETFITLGILAYSTDVFIKSFEHATGCKKSK